MRLVPREAVSRPAARVGAATILICLVAAFALRAAGAQFATDVGVAAAVVAAVAATLTVWQAERDKGRAREQDERPPARIIRSEIPSWPPDHREVAVEVAQVLLTVDRVCRGGDPRLNGRAGPFVEEAIATALTALEGTAAERLSRRLESRGLDPSILIRSLPGYERAMSAWSPADFDGQLTRALGEFRLRLLGSLGRGQGSYLPKNAQSFFRDARANLEEFPQKWAAVLPSVSSLVGKQAKLGTDAPLCPIPDDDYFVGRSAEIATAVSLVQEAISTPGRAVGLITGQQAGVGVSAMTRELARTLERTDLFPGGVLYLNLNGLDGDQRMTDADAARKVVAALGVRPSAWPLADYEPAMRDKGVLLVLDNAEDDSHVAQLARPIPTCCVLVTSRAHTHGYPHFPLQIGRLPREDSIALLREYAEPSSAERPTLSVTQYRLYRQLAKYCDDIPMALELVGARLKSRRPGTDLTAYLNWLKTLLRAEPHRLRALEGQGQAISRAIGLSYNLLEDDDKRLLRMCHTVRKRDVTSEEVAFCLDRERDADRVEVSLAHFADISLASQALPPLNGSRVATYSLFNFVRWFADELRREDSPASVAEFTRRFVTYMRDCLNALRRHDTGIRHEDPRLADDQAPVIDAVRLALGNGWDDLGIPLETALREYLVQQGPPDAAVRTLLKASRRFRKADLPLEARASLLTAALRAAQQALELARRHDLVKLIPRATSAVSQAAEELQNWEQPLRTDEAAR